MNMIDFGPLARFVHVIRVLICSAPFLRPQSNDGRLMIAGRGLWPPLVCAYLHVLITLPAVLDFHPTASWRPTTSRDITTASAITRKAAHDRQLSRR